MSDNLTNILKIFVVILVVIAIGMGGWLVYSNLTNEDDDTGTQDEIVELEWWVLWEKKENAQVLVDLYEQEHPNVSITITTQVETQYKEKLQQQLGDTASTAGPDIVRIHNTWVPLLQSKLYPLPSSVMSQSAYAETFYSVALSDSQGSDGNIYAIPLMYDGIGVYYNKELLKKGGYTVPEDTWDDFVIQAKALTEYNEDGTIKIAGAGLGSADNVDFSFDIANLLMLQEGAQMVNDSGSVTFALDEDQKAARALKFYIDFVTRHDVWDRSLPRDITMFAQGQLAMMFAPSWRVFDINNALQTSNATLDYDVAPVPQQPTEQQTSVNWANYWLEAVSASSEHPEVAWDFLAFITEKENLRTFYEKSSETRAFGEIYPRKDMADEIVGDQYVGAYVKMADSARSWRMVNREQVAALFDELIENYASTGSVTISGVQSSLENTASSVQQIISGVTTE